MQARLLNLIQRGLVTKSKLLDIVAETNAAIDKASKEIVHKFKFKDEHLMKVIEEQFESSLSFRDACKKLGLWTEEMEHFFAAESKKARCHFYRLLEKETGVPEKMLSLAFSKDLGKQSVEIKDAELAELKAELVSLLDMVRDELKMLVPGMPMGNRYHRIFRITQSLTNASAMVGILRLHHVLLETETMALSLSENSVLLPLDIQVLQEQMDKAKKLVLLEQLVTEKIVKPKPILVPKPVVAEDPVEAPIILEDLSFTEIDEASVQDFCETFDDTRHRKMEESLIKLESIVSANTAIKGALIEEDLKVIYRDLHSIKGSARFTSAMLIEKIIHAAEDVLGFTQKFFDKLSSQDHQRIFQSMLNTIDLAWELRNELLQNRTEIGFWENAAKRERYTIYLGLLEELKTDLESRDFKVDLAEVESIF